MIKYLFIFLILAFHGISITQAATSQEIDPEVLHVRIEQIVWHTGIPQGNTTSFKFIVTLSLWNPAGTNIEYVHATLLPLFDLDVNATLKNTSFITLCCIKVSADLITTATYPSGISSLQVSASLTIKNYTQDFLPNGLYAIHPFDNREVWTGNQVRFYGVSITITNDDTQIMFDPVSDK